MEIPIPTLHLFEPLDEHLISMLKSLRAEDWHKPTMAKQWSVKDVAAHLLDGNIRTISMLRDGFWGPQPENIHSYQDLVNYLNQLNADWVKSYKRVSSELLIEQLERTGKEYVATLRTLDPFAKAAFSVAWAGETESQNWFHIAREYTEKWHHQKQIREAVGHDGLMERTFFFPVMDTFMRALPVAYQTMHGNSGDIVQVEIEGEGGGIWGISYTDSGWVRTESIASPPIAKVKLTDADAWKLFTKGLSPEVALERIRITGSEALGKQIVKMIAIMG